MSGPELEKYILEYLRLKGYEKAVDGLETHGVTAPFPERSANGSQEGLQQKLAEELINWAQRTDNNLRGGAGSDTPDKVQAKRINATPLQLGWLEDDLENECARIVEREAAEENGEEDVENMSPSRKQKRQEEETVARKRRSRTIVPAQIPVPLPSEEVKFDMLHSMRSRCHVSENALPSAAMYTFLNVPSRLNTSLLLYDGASIVGGFSDAMIRSFDMDSASERPENPGFNDEQDEPEDVRQGKLLAGHTKAVQSLSWFDEESLMLSGSSDGTIRLWSERLCSNLVVFKGHLFPVWDVDACPRGYYFASASYDSTARVWCTERLDAVRLFAGHQGSVDFVRWHPSCNVVATASSDQSVRLWDVTSGECVRMIPDIKQRITAMEFGPDAKSIYCGHENGQISGYDISKPAQIGQCSAHQGPVWSMAFSRGTGELLATGGDDDTLRLWSATLTQDILKPVKTFTTRATPVQSVFWTNTNLLVAAGSPRINKSITPV
ncbi:hypothetical protein BSKO_04045 [Bryopsis sp. KO-2023]|nr:hypothetical protein BSKO_04045 [Bryopsis sp. KO-2023]